MPRFGSRRGFGGFRGRGFGGSSKRGSFYSRRGRRSFPSGRRGSFSSRFLRRRRGYSLDAFERRKLRRKLLRKKLLRKAKGKSLRATSGGLLTKEQIISKTRLHITNLHPKVSNEELKVRNKKQIMFRIFL